MRWLLLSLAIISTASWANELNYNLVSLSAKAERDVPNDLMTVTLAVEHQGDKPASVARKVNEDMAWALAALKRHKGIKAETQQYNTYPIYDKQKIKGWRASQQLQLESEDFSLLSTVLRDLQTRLQIKNMQFSPTKKTRKRVEDELITEALAEFQHRAGLVQKALSAKGYKTVDININTQGGYQPIPYRHERMAVSSMKMDVEPAVQGGESTLNVHINGSIQLN